jgi:alpha-mannosidase
MFNQDFVCVYICRMVSKSKIDSIKHSLPQFRIDNAPSVVLETIKRAEDSNDIIIRMFEAYGGHARARLIRYIVYFMHQYGILMIRS